MASAYVVAVQAQCGSGSALLTVGGRRVICKIGGQEVSRLNVWKCGMDFQTGSVCVQVNAGPQAYANAFLEASQASQFPDDRVEELKDVFREFVQVCYVALQLNSQVMRANQTEYQTALQQNFHKLT